MLENLKRIAILNTPASPKVERGMLCKWAFSWSLYFLFSCLESPSWLCKCNVVKRNPCLHFRRTGANISWFNCSVVQNKIQITCYFSLWLRKRVKIMHTDLFPAPVSYPNPISPGFSGVVTVSSLALTEGNRPFLVLFWNVVHREKKRSSLSMYSFQLLSLKLIERADCYYGKLLGNFAKCLQSSLPLWWHENLWK